MLTRLNNSNMPCLQIRTEYVIIAIELVTSIGVFAFQELGAPFDVDFCSEGLLGAIADSNRTEDFFAHRSKGFVVFEGLGLVWL